MIKTSYPTHIQWMANQLTTFIRCPGVVLVVTQLDNHRVIRAGIIDGPILACIVPGEIVNDKAIDSLVDAARLALVEHVNSLPA